MSRRDPDSGTHFQNCQLWQVHYGNAPVPQNGAAIVKAERERIRRDNEKTERLQKLRLRTSR